MRGWLKLERLANEYGFDLVVTYRPNPDPFWKRWTIVALVDLGRHPHAPYAPRIQKLYLAEAATLRHACSEASKRFRQIVIERAVAAS